MNTPSKGTSRRRMDREGSVCSTSGIVSSVASASSTSTGNSKSKLAVRHQKCLPQSQSPSSALPEMRKEMTPKGVGTKSSAASTQSTPKSADRKRRIIRNDLFGESSPRSKKEEPQKSSKKRPASPDRPSERKKQAFECSGSSDRDLEEKSGGAAETKLMNTSKNLDHEKVTATVEIKNAEAAPFGIASRLSSPIMKKDTANKSSRTTGATSSKPSKHGDYSTNMDKKETTTGTESMDIETETNADEGEDYSETTAVKESGDGGTSSQDVNEIEIEPSGNSTTADIEAETGEDQKEDTLNENESQNQVDIDTAEKVGKTGGMFSRCTIV